MDTIHGLHSEYHFSASPPASQEASLPVVTHSTDSLLAQGPAMFGPVDEDLVEPLQEDEHVPHTDSGDVCSSLALQTLSSHDEVHVYRQPQGERQQSETTPRVQPRPPPITRGTRQPALSANHSAVSSTADMEDVHFASVVPPIAARLGHFSDDDEDGAGTDGSHGTPNHRSPSLVEHSSPLAVAPHDTQGPSGHLMPPPPQSPSSPGPGKSAPKAKANGARIAAWLRSRVSQNKVRYRDDQFNLDLTYITHRIIAMGYPAHGTEYYIRNPIDKVEAFLDQRHPRHFRVYNLCSERWYDSAARFHGQFKRFPFEDHNAPALALMCDFVSDAVAFLSENPENVVVVHCKAGKGRTGIMVSCLLFRLFPQRFPTGQSAMEYFNTRRTCDGAGLTIPSQQRYVEYYVRILREWNGIPPAVNKVVELCELVVSKAAFQQPLTNHADFYFTIMENGKPRLDSRIAFPKGPVFNEVGLVFTFPSPFVRLAGGIKVIVYRRRPIVLAGTESPGFYVWFDTNFCDTNSVVLARGQLDKVDEAAFTKMTAIGFRFHDAVSPPPLPLAAATQPA